MKKIFYSILFVATAVLLNSCTDENEPIFIADLSSEEIAFKNSFATEYLLSVETEDNIADRFIWNETTIGTNNTYEVQGSIDPLFATYIAMGTTTDTNFPVLISQLLNLAEQLGLDDDPTTINSDGSANNTGTVYFRVKAKIGNDGAGTEEIFSEIQSINIVWIEQEVISDTCDPLYALGDAVVDAGWSFPGIEFKCSQDILEAKLSLTNGTFRFFEAVDDWGSGVNYTDFAGYTIDADLVDKEDGDHNFEFIGTPGIYTLTIDHVNKEITLVPSTSLWAVGGAVPGGWGFNNDTIEFIEGTPNVWSASITLTNDVFRFFHEFETWDTENNYDYYDNEGFTIDPNLENDGSGDANFKFVGTPGTYTLTINAIEKVITLE